jgi:DNA-binding NarL/FixJ family response regulator
MAKIRVLVADDSALMRQTLKRIIAAAADLDLVGLARDGEDAVAKARELRPDETGRDHGSPNDSRGKDLSRGHAFFAHSAVGRDYVRMP